MMIGLFLTFSSISQAKIIDLREQPNAASKIISKVDTANGVITIFMPKDSQWIKVADPQNGNVGWIPISELSHTGISFNVITTNNGETNFQVIQFGKVKQYTSEQLTTAAKKMQIRQQAIQKDMQQMMQNIMKDMNAWWKEFPFVMPVVVVPEKPDTEKQDTTSSKQ